MPREHCTPLSSVSITEAEQINIPRNAAASSYNAWFRKEFPELYECEISEVVESCEACGFCNEAKGEEADHG